MLAAYVLLRLALARLSVPLGGLLALAVALASVEAIALAAIRGARQADQLPAGRPAIYAGCALLALASGAAALGLRRRRLAAVAGAVAAGLLALRLLLPNAHGWIGAPDDGTRPQVGPPVVFVVLDTLRADALDLGDPESSRTPSLAWLAARGAAHAGVANASWTLPGHASLFTGLRLSHHRTDQTVEPGFSGSLRREVPIVHQLFAERGYRTVCVAANGIVGPSSGLSRGCGTYANPGRVWMRRTLPRRLAELALPSSLALEPVALEWTGVGGNATAHEVVDAALASIQGEPHSLYLFLNFLDAHGPYAPSPERLSVAPEARRALRAAYLRRMLGGATTDDLMREHRDTLRAYYDAQVRELDSELGRFFAELEERGWLDAAVVLVTSDHGEAFDENPAREGYFGHHSAFEPAVRIPLVWKRAGQDRRASEARAFQQVDVLPTLLEAAGLPPLEVDGAALSQPPKGPLVTEWFERSSPGSFPYFRGNRLAVYEGDLKYVRERGRDERLYDLAASPYEAVDVAPQQPDALARLRGVLDRVLPAAAPDGEHAPQTTDPAQLEQLRALGYVE
jgi:arylsulfatase A-like enzyme